MKSWRPTIPRLCQSLLMCKNSQSIAIQLVKMWRLKIYTRNKYEKKVVFLHPFIEYLAMH